MQLLTPSAVAMADRILIVVWIANFQISFFFIVFDVLISHWLIFKGHTEITEIAARGVFLCPAEMAEIAEIAAHPVFARQIEITEMAAHFQLFAEQI